MPASNLEWLRYEEYRPNGMTALLDAIGESVKQIKKQYQVDIENDLVSVVVIILTDGMENASRIYKYHQIAKMIEELEETDKWIFSFLGADIDAIHTSSMINIRKENVISFSKKDISSTMDIVLNSTRKFTESKSHGKVNVCLYPNCWNN